ncbi:hypothetical protein H0H81_002643 [Sphagnurus paluster]|uniref:Uncharacterized protein n=1 Tax=Sphagnurus paluster TaxID=117069 RepID=A0A9P7KHS2_9AGAR|nr:hypothetical protein H0H81_002643 [Sphagnurus paluster]
MRSSDEEAAEAMKQAWEQQNLERREAWQVQQENRRLEREPTPDPGPGPEQAPGPARQAAPEPEQEALPTVVTKTKEVPKMGEIREDMAVEDFLEA